MNEQNELLQFPLVACYDTPGIRVILRCVLFGLTQYVHFLPASKEKELCFEALDPLLLRLQSSDGEIRLEDHEIGEALEAMGGFILTLYNLHPATEKDHLRLFITSWCGRLKMQVTPSQ
jgi:hypothetical protein